MSTCKSIFCSLICNRPVLKCACYHTLKDNVKFMWFIKKSWHNNSCVTKHDTKNRAFKWLVVFFQKSVKYTCIYVFQTTQVWVQIVITITCVYLYINLFCLRLRSWVYLHNYLKTPFLVQQRCCKDVRLSKYELSNDATEHQHNHFLFCERTFVKMIVMHLISISCWFVAKA